MWKTGAQRLGFSAPDVMHVWRNIRHRAGGGRTGWTGVGSRTFRDVDVAVAVGVDGVLGIASSAHVDRTEPGVACGTRDGSRGVQHVRCDEEGVWRDLEGEYRGDSRLGTKKRAGVAGVELRARCNVARIGVSGRKREVSALTSGSDAKLARRGMPRSRRTWPERRCLLSTFVHAERDGQP